MKRYEEYKDSGVQWLGEIPGHWKRAKVANLFKQIGSGTTPSSGDTSYYADKGTPWLQSGDFNNNEIHFTSKYITNKALDNYSLRLYKPGGIVIAMYGASIGKVGLLNIATTVNQACCVLSDSDYLLQKYAFYLFINEKENLIKKSNGGTQPNISQEIIKSHYLPLPPLSEQQAIVSFLDTKTSQIDTYIAGKEKEIDLLKSTKQRIIADAVTKGIKPGVEMRETCIPWLPEIPKHWDMKPIRSLLKESDEKSETGSEELLSLSQYSGVTYKKDTPKTGMFEAESTIGYKKVHPGQFVMNIMLAWNGSYAVSDIEGIISPAYCIFSFICECEKKYFDYLLRTKMYAGAFKTQSRGIIESRLRLYPNRFYPFYVPIPPLSEQQSIVAFIKEKTEAIDSAIEKLENQIELMKQYKQRLISDVVTGQIKVC